MGYSVFAHIIRTLLKDYGCPARVSVKYHDPDLLENPYINVKIKDWKDRLFAASILPEHLNLSQINIVYEKPGTKKEKKSKEKR